MIKIALLTLIVVIVIVLVIPALEDKHRAGGAPEPQKPVEPKDPDLEKPE